MATSACSARPARASRTAQAAGPQPLRQVIESVNDTFKGQLDLERHGGHTPAGVIVRVLQRIRALDRRDLAQRPDRPAHQALTHRI
jgi:hypothetical protein